MLKNLSAIAIAILAICGQAYSQFDNYLKDKVPPTPNAASLGKYGEIPVSKHTGTPEIKIPVYDFVAGDLSLPLSLSYHASGIRVNEVSSWVGLGWTFNAGGMISRTVMGEPDEGGTVLGDYGLHLVDGWYESYGAVQLDGNSPESDRVDAHNRVIDSEPDMFFFNFSGVSGKFFFDENREAHVIPEQGVKITANYDVNQQQFLGFTIIIADGTQYIFGGNDAIERTASYKPQFPNLTPVRNAAWYLTEVRSATTQDVIHLDYEREYYMFRNVGSRLYRNEGPGVCPVDVDFHSDVYQYDGHLNNTENQMVTEVEGLRLVRIESSSYSIDFEATDLRNDLDRWTSPLVIFPANNSGAWFNHPPKRLNDIVVRGKNSDILKKFALGCDYFESFFQPGGFPGDGSIDYNINNNIQGNPDDYRLRLRYFAELSNDSQDSLKHIFTYFESDFPENGLSMELPPRKTFAQDDYGYFNGEIFNNTLMPNLSLEGPTGNVVSCQYGADRSPKFPEMLVGTLAKIIYPTGGISSFEFGPHQQQKTILTTREATGFLANDNGVTCGSSNLSGAFIGYPIPFNTYPEEKNGYVEILLSGAGNQVDQDVWSNTMAQQWGICLSTGTATHDITNLFNQYAYNDACPSGFQCEVRIPMYELKTQFGINYGDPIYISGFILDENHSLTVGLKTFKEEAGNVDVGGIRVEKTFTDDKNGNVITKNFNYNTSDLGFSSGVVIGEKKYVRKQLNPFGDYTAIMNPGGDPCGDHSCTNQRNMYSDNSVVPLESTLGSHIGYVVVEEYQVGNGKTVCQYRVSSGNTAGIFDYPIPSWSQSDLLNGRLENEKIFDESGNLVKEVTFKYSLNQTKSLNLQSIYSGTSTPCIPAVIGDVNWGADQALLEVYANLDACISFDGGQTWTYQPEYYLILQNYQLKTGYVVLDEKTEVLDGVTKHITFQYDNQWRHGNPTEIKAQNSDGVFGIEKFVYASELEITANPWNWQEEALEYMNQNNINLPIETSQWIKKPGQTEKCINSALKLYKKSNQNLINLSRVWTTEFTTPSVDFEQVKISSSGGFLEKDPAYQTHGENVPVVQLHHNNHGNLETQTLAFGQPSCLIWNADNFFPLANVDNADIHEVAYTSFESTDNEGGWTFNNMTSNVAFAGLLSKNLNQGPVQKTSLFKGNYLISFWQRSGVVNIVVNGSVVASFNGTNNFEKRQIELSLPLNTNNQIEVSGTSLIDELRLCPSDALMATTVFDKDNVILAKLDENNNVISQFEYDDFNRLGIVRDMFGNIIKSYEYVYDQDMGLSSITTKIPRIEGVTSLQDLANLDPDEMSHNVQYIDGLGRTLQSISVKGSPSKKDIVSMLKYNDLGRMDKSYLSFTRFSNDGSFFPNAELLQNLFYGSISDAKAYEEMEYDLSPLNRVIKLARPGSNMAMGSGHEIETVFRSNTLNEVRLFTSSGVSTGFYAPNTLFAVETINENEHKLITYTDLRGREILRDNEGFKTYTIYDDFGRKSWVVPPKALAQMEASGQYICNLPTINPGLFSYLYNAQGLVARKKLPGADQVRFYYNRQNLLVNKIDGNDNQHFTKYDILGRPILEGLYQGSALPANTDGLFESATSSGHGYTTSNSFPSSNIEIHKVTYYDHYDFNRDGQEDASESPFASQDAVYDDSIEAMMKGNVTGTKVAVFGRFGNDIEQYLAKRSYFNNKKESVQVIAENLTGEEDVTLSKYDFNGNLIHEKVLHRSQFGTLQSTIQESEFVYDHNGRALKHYIGLNGQPKQLISKTSYNEREQVSAKRLGATNEAETKFLQTVNYGYDILNRLVSINNPDNCGDSHISVIGKGGRGLKQLKGKETPVSTISDDIFAMKFYYDQTKTGLSISPQFNNNVSALEYRDGCDALKKGYGFVYDNRDRLVSAQYAAANAASVFSSDNTYSLENVDYDENGNITALKRNGLSGLGMDDLDYTIGLNNQLEYIEELGDNTAGYVQNTTNGAFEYDDNGNMTRDNGRTLNILYNADNLPYIFAFDNEDSIRYTYDAENTKLRVETKAHNQSNWQQKDYILGFEYYEGAMEAVYHESGRIVPSSNSYEYQYHIKDQLGNSRVCFTDKNNDGKIKEDDGEVLQRNHYYPFGADQEGAWSTVIGIKNNYQYNGKEFQNAFGLDWYDYGSRHYDPHLGKWHSIDPKAEDFHEWSPYNYVLNNPIKLIDPDGEAPSNGDDPEPFVSVNKPRTPKGPYLKLSFDVSAGPHTKSGTRMLGIGEKFEAGVSFKVIGAELLIGVTENYLNLRVMNTGEQEIVLGGSHVAAGGSVTLTRTVKDGEITSTAEGKVQAGPIFVKQSSSLDGNSSNNDLTAGFEFFSSSSSLPLASGDGNFFSVNLSASIENISTRIGMQGDAADGYALSYKANRAHVRSRMHARGIDPNDPYGIKAAKRKKAEKEARRKLRAEYYKLTGEWYWGDFPIKK